MITIDPPSSFQIGSRSGSQTGLQADLRIGLLTLSKSTLTRFLNRARIAVGLPGSVSVLLSTDAELKRLNRRFRGKNRPTDVLSFPSDPIPGLPSAHQHAGDLAVSLETAGRQAAEHGHLLAVEIRVLLLHGLLHLAGLDHETDRGEMAAREFELRARFRLSNTLIARTLTPPGPSSRPKAKRSEAAAERPLYLASVPTAAAGKRQLKTDHSQRSTRGGPR